IASGRDGRPRVRCQLATHACVDPEKDGRRRFVEYYDFGATYLRDMTVRWVNLGRGSAQGTSRTLAGEETSTPLFRLCAACGKLDKATGANRPSEHRPWCRLRRAAEEQTATIARTRAL